MPPPIEQKIVVDISNTQSHLAVDLPGISTLIRAVLSGEGIEAAAISLAIVDDATIHEVNRRHLDHDWPTDVITFPLSDEDDEELAAELIVSAEMARTTAERAGTNPLDELSLYIVHGLLHLCGYDDLTPDGSAAMRRREGEVLHALGLTNTFARTGEPADEGRGESSVA